MDNRDPHAGQHPQEHAERAETARLLHEELAQLGDEERALVTLCFQEGLDLAQAAAVLEAPRETLRDRLARTLTRLRERLGKRGVMLSLPGVAGLMGESSATEAPARLCSSLDTQLAGPPCAQVPACAPAGIDAATLLSQAGIPAVSAGTKWATPAAIAAVLIVAVAVTAWTRQTPAAAVAQPETSGPPRNAPAALPKPERKSQAPAVAAPKQEAPATEPLPLPAQIRAAVAASFPDLVPQELEIERRGEKTFFEIEGVAGGKRYEMVVDEEGHVVKIEEEEDEEDGPREKPKPVPKHSEEF